MSEKMDSQLTDSQVIRDKVEFLDKTTNPDHYEDSREVKAFLKEVLRFIGDDPDRDGLQDTPSRIIKSWGELFIGYKQTRDQILKTTVENNNYEQAVLLKNIDFGSFCEHHFLPFVGVAHVAYIPNPEESKVVGLSKLARLVDMHAKRLQIQEKMTADIATDLWEVLKPKGAAVIIEAHHSCMGCRGVKKPNGVMVTSHLLGLYKDDASARAELYNMIRGK